MPIYWSQAESWEFRNQSPIGNRDGGISTTGCFRPHQVCGRNPDVFTFQYRSVITEYFDERCRDISLHLVAAWLAEVGRSHERFDGPEHLVGMLGQRNAAKTRQ